ncbi:MAG: NosD domain-containing protein [Planctomycetota bacterium]|nr:NosD domain-containing protein [Planctomycetota bacterium]
MKAVTGGAPTIAVRAVSALAATMLAAIGARGEEVVPTNGMIITEDTTFVLGSYELPDGVSIGADGITLDMNGAELIGSFEEGDEPACGVTCIGHDEVVIKNGIVRGYYYGMCIKDGSGLEILDNELSRNWVDPDSQGAFPPWLNINAEPDLGDTVNLGGGLYVFNVSDITISGNTLCEQENGIDLYYVTESLISNNNASHNTGWGIHLHESTLNTITGNTCDHCIRANLGDSAGVLLVMNSNGNQIQGNSFRYGGDGFFIGNEHGCPSNDNVVIGNDGSFAGANAFEATFSSGNQFLDNIAEGSNYGFWLGYSHSGNEIIGNSIRANNANGVEIEHGQDNVIRGNLFEGNGGKAIVLRTDGLVHFPPDEFECLNLPNQEASGGYVIEDNIIKLNFGLGIELINTTDSVIVNNLIGGNAGGTASATGENNVWSVDPVEGENIVGGPYLGGNYWDNYEGEDLDEDGLGDTGLPYTNNGAIELPGDEHPLIGDPDIGEIDNPRSLCARHWIDLGRNTRTNGATFSTSNGTHFATDGEELYLLEGANSTRLSRFDPDTERYEPKADVPQSVWDGGCFQYGDGFYYATVGVAFDQNNGSGRGPWLYAWDPTADQWQTRAATAIEGDPVANEALAYDPGNERLYATMVSVLTTGDPTLLRKLAIYDPAIDGWVGATSDSGVDFGPGSELEYLDGRIYAWPGSHGGGAVNGSDSYLLVYDIASDTWSATPTLQDSTVIPGFRSGAFDIWGVTITADPDGQRLFVQGGEGNRQIYIFDVPAQGWTVAPTAVYDGGWGDGLEYVSAAERLYQIDGRNALGTPQGTAMFLPSGGDIDGDGAVNTPDLLDLLGAWGPCDDPCCPADLDENGEVGTADLLILLGNWG